LTKVLNCFGRRKVLSCPRNTYLPNIFARRNAHAAAQSARIRAAKSAKQIRKPRLAAAGNNTRGARHRHARTRPLKPLRRCNTALAPPPSTHPRMPGAYISEPSFVVPGLPDVDDRHIPPLVAQKIFLDALYAQRQLLLRATEERDEEAEAACRHAAAEEAERARVLEQESRRMPCAHCKEEAEAKIARQREEERRKAEAVWRRAQDAAFARMLEEDRRRAQEAHRRAMEQEEEERESRERERRERERHERETSSATASVPPRLAQRLHLYEAKWDELRKNRVAVGQLRFCDVPWPVFEDVRRVDDVTRERVLAFVLHGRKEGDEQAKAVRSEMLRWHPDKFNGKVLDKVIEGDREAVRDTAGHVARILTRFSAENR
jgi:flagellar biosynthesis GTPase FlhF